MPSVTIPADFFRGELRVYGDWREALARELLQNSVDAAPTRIDIVLRTEDGHGVVEFTDNGHGMTRRVLEDVFFALGRTTKTGDGVVGGFGRARIITCFAQTRYTIRTRNLLVAGHGGEYTVTETPDHVRGCVFTITLLDETHEPVERAFRNLLSRCSLTVPVTLNGERVGQQRLPDRATRVLRDADGREWAKVYVQDGWGQVHTRVRGLLMFTRWYEGEDNISLELTPSRSRDVLSASRDTLHTTYGAQLDQFLSQLSQNRRKALRPPAAPLDVHVGGGGFIVTDAAVAPAAAVPGGPAGGSTPTPDAGDRPADPADPAAVEQDATAGTPVTVRVQAGNQAAYVNLANARPTATRVTPDAPAVELGFDVFLMADVADTGVRKLARAWDPTGWDARTGTRRRRLLLTWKAACAVAVDALVAVRPSLDRVVWTVGWTFDSDVIAVHRSLGNGHVLALNPVTAAGTTRYQVSSRTDRRSLLASALHEAAHVVCESHNEDFASVLTALYGHVDQAEADRTMREAGRA